MKKIIVLGMFFVFSGLVMKGQEGDLTNLIQALQKSIDANQHRYDVLEKKIDDVLWQQNLGDAAFIDKVIIAGPPVKVKNPTAMGAGNPLKFSSYVFIPKGIDLDKKYPLIVLVHGGVHGNFGTYHTHIVRELMAQGYIVVAPEYRGSTGYGESFWRAIDYGGLEIRDSEASRAYMVENYSFIDKNRVGVVG
ncbi:MAG: prolyl oligopeptidase family serine peptidase, partial [Tannerella sp.]|nr:prolyl oligopeptidase family serine peptidase [Tannerella sp.]